MHKVLGFDEELVGHVAKKGVDPAPQGAGHSTGPGHAVRVAQGQGEKLSSIGRQIEDHRGSEVVGEHHANLVDERAGDDQVPGAVRVAEELLERRMAERVLLRRLDRLPALGDAREQGPERPVCLHRVGDKVVLEDAELGVVHHELVDSLWEVRLMVAGDEGDLHSIGRLEIVQILDQTWCPCFARDPARGVQADKCELRRKIINGKHKSGRKVMRTQADMEFVTRVTCKMFLASGKFLRINMNSFFFCVICLNQARNVVAFHKTAGVSLYLSRKNDNLFKIYE